MESHILNSYHHARYRIHGHNRMGSARESYSSESSCNQNSPDYPEKFAPQAPEYQEEAQDDWQANHKGVIKAKVKREDSSESSSDDEVPESALPETEQNDQSSANEYYSQELVVDSDEDYEIVVDDDTSQTQGQIIQVYAVDPNLDLEASDDEQVDDWSINQEKVTTDDEDDGEYLEEAEHSDGPEEKTGYSNTNRGSIDNLPINLDAPVVSNVDEYFIKEPQTKHDEKILEVKDHPVVSDVDEYFIKNNKVNNPPEEVVPNVDDYFVKDPHVKEAEKPSTVTDLPNVDEFFNKDVVKIEQSVTKTDSVLSSDPGILPHIEHIKRFLLEDMPCPKMQSKTVQRSCSLPHSPAHFNYLDVDDAKTTLSFEDLNLDLTDFMFKAEKSFVLPSVSSGNKSEDSPRTLTEEDVNSFLIKSKPEIEQAFEDTKDEDDLCQEDMDLDSPVDSKLEHVNKKMLIEPINTKIVSVEKPVDSKILAASTPKSTKSPTLFDFCMEKPSPAVNVKMEIEVKVEHDDYVDVESLNDTVIPVLEANNVGSLLEQFEASEKININVRKKPQIKIEPEVKPKTIGLANGTRLQDAGVQLNKNKMRQILMSAPSSNSTSVKKSQPVHSDHDYCSPKKRHSLPASLKKGQSLLKPEVLSSNNKILNSRHRTCKNKKIVYNMSSDDETTDSSSGSKIKTSVKPSVKAPLVSNHRKKLSPSHSISSGSSKEKCNVPVISSNASKASDNCSQSSSGSIKLTIKNKSKVILKIDCDDEIDSHKIIKPSAVIKTVEIKPSVCKPADGEKNKIVKHKHVDSKVNKIEANSIGNKVSNDVVIKTELRPEKEHFYTALFKNKQDIQISIPEPAVIKNETKTLEIIEKQEMVDITTPIVNSNVETKPLKKKLNLQEYKLRKEGVSSNGSSRTVSPEAIFPDMPGPHNFDKIQIVKSQTSPNNAMTNVPEKVQIETPKKIFDPIKEASRKILANTKKQKAEAIRKRDEDIVMRKIPKVENLQLQPLMSDAEMLKIAGIVPGENLSRPLPEKSKSNTDYEEIILVSVATNTDKAIFKQMKKSMDNMKKALENERRKCKSPSIDKTTGINFKIKKPENVLKQNIFDSTKKDKGIPDDKNERTNMSPTNESKIDKERYKDITATLKSVGKQVDTKISSNSLFASIQDTVMKKAPDGQDKKRDERKSKTLSPVEKKTFFRSTSMKTTIVREYDTKSEHGEDKIILHLEKNRSKPGASNMVVQTDPTPEFIELDTLPEVKLTTPSLKKSSDRKRTASDMSVSTEENHTRKPNDIKEKKKTSEEKIKPVEKQKPRERKESRTEKRSRSRERRSRSRDSRSYSKERYESKYRRRSRSRSRRSRSRSRRPRRRSRSRSRSKSRGRSRSVDRYRRYKRSDSPYKRTKRSRSRYRRPSSGRSRSRKRDYRRTRSRSRNNSHRSRSPVAKKTKSSPEKDGKAEKRVDPSMTPPLRKPTLSESSESSTSSSSSSDSAVTSSSSASSRSRSRSKSRRRSSSPAYRKRTYRSYSSEARECNTPVEERRIVFVGKLETDMTKSQLRGLFSKFGPILDVTLHCKEDGCRYGFVTYRLGRDAWTAVESASCFPQYDVGFGGRRAFCRQRYADLDGLEAEYTEIAYMGQPTSQPAARATTDNMSFEQMLLDMKNKLSQRKSKQDDSEP